ncbi:hypothetical protein A5641_08110 [Mycobacterium sp. 1554424.7]|nr:hypothetical protein A5641_08110 [Mycobacterium sp. 1554424.7]
MMPHIVMTVSGTGVDMWNTAPPQPAGVAAALAAASPDLFYWQPVGNYPASVFPMGPSVDAGVAELNRLCTQINPPDGAPSYPENSIILLGYSQGAIVVCQFLHTIAWLNPQIANRIVAVGVWGNPLRLPGFASGNQFAGWPMPANVDGVVTGGVAGPACMRPEDVAPHLLTPVRHFWGDFVNTIGVGNDIYTDAPVGPDPWTAEAGPGVIETQIYNIVQNANSPNIFAILRDALKLVNPATSVEEIIYITEAIYNGGMFWAAGPNASHYTYDTTPVYNFIALAGQETQPFSTGQV